MIDAATRRHGRVVRPATALSELSTGVWFKRLDPAKQRFLTGIATDLAGAFQLAPKQVLDDLTELVRAYEDEEI